MRMLPDNARFHFQAPPARPFSTRNSMYMQSPLTKCTTRPTDSDARRLPESQRQHLSRVSKARATLRAANPTKPVTREELAAATGLSLKKVRGEAGRVRFALTKRGCRGYCCAPCRSGAGTVLDLVLLSGCRFCRRGEGVTMLEVYHIVVRCTTTLCLSCRTVVLPYRSRSWRACRGRSACGRWRAAGGHRRRRAAWRTGSCRWVVGAVEGNGGWLERGRRRSRGCVAGRVLLLGEWLGCGVRAWMVCCRVVGIREGRLGYYR